MKNTFQEYAHYYNMFYENKNYKEEARTIHHLLNKYKVNTIEKILDLGCGTGMHDVELAQLGYKMHGIDLSNKMISIANKNLPLCLQSNVSYEVGDAQKYDVKKIYDAVISLFHVICYQNENNEIINFMKTASKSLDSGGVFLFDLWYGPGVLSEKPSVRIKEFEDEKNRVIRLAQPTMHNLKNTVDVNYNILVTDKESSIVTEFKEIHSMRYFFAPEIQFYLENSGFDFIDCVDCKTLDDVSFESWTAYFIARKR